MQSILFDAIRGHDPKDSTSLPDATRCAGQQNKK